MRKEFPIDFKTSGGLYGIWAMATSIIALMAFSQRQYLDDAQDVPNAAPNISTGILIGDDFMLVNTGFNNFTIGNSEEDTMIARGGQGRFLGGD